MEIVNINRRVRPPIEKRMEKCGREDSAFSNLCKDAMERVETVEPQFWNAQNLDWIKINGYDFTEL